jgi:ferredoxin
VRCAGTVVGQVALLRGLSGSWRPSRAREDEFVLSTIDSSSARCHVQHCPSNCSVMLVRPESLRGASTAQLINVNLNYGNAGNATRNTAVSSVQSVKGTPAQVLLAAGCSECGMHNPSSSALDCRNFCSEHAGGRLQTADTLVHSSQPHCLQACPSAASITSQQSIFIDHQPGCLAIFFQEVDARRAFGFSESVDDGSPTQSHIMYVLAVKCWSPLHLLRNLPRTNMLVWEVGAGLLLLRCDS